MTTCRACGRDLPDEARFCQACGQAVVPGEALSASVRMVCPSCHVEVRNPSVTDDGLRYICPWCAHHFDLTP